MTMVYFSLLASLLAAGAAAQNYLIPPPTTALNGTILDCTNWEVATATSSCTEIASFYGITLDQFENVYNPSVGAGCVLIVGDSYCVEEDFGIPPVTTSSAVPTTTGNGVTTPSPIQTGMVSNCNAFYLVKSGDSCGAVESMFSISLDQLVAWNPAIGSTCAFLDVGDYVCVNIIGNTIVTTTSVPPTATNGITTPTPIQTGMVSNCNAFYQVKTGDSCGAVESMFSISLDQLVAWNPAIGSTCGFLDVGDFICVDVIGNTITTTTSSTPTNGITTPTPIQTGMVSNCNAFYQVKTGDSCGAVESMFSISLDQLVAWNPAIGSTCGFLDVGDFICVDVIGNTITTTTSSTPANGITTPTPIQTGMVSNCDSFYQVKTGDSCGAVESEFSISLDELVAWNPAIGSTCGFLDVGDFICVATIGFVPTTTTPSTPTTTKGNGVTTPTPFEPGMVSNCAKFWFVETGDTCDSIAKGAGITDADIETWNPMVGSSCGFLFLNEYICVGLL